MVAFGPWTQGADFPHDIRYPRSAPEFDGIISATLTDQLGPFADPFLIGIDKPHELMQEAAARTNNAGPVVTQSGSYIAWNYRLGQLEWYTEWTGAAAKTRWKIQPRDGYFYSPDSYEGVAVPEGAVGIEYEGVPWNPDEPFGYADVTPVKVEMAPGTSFTGDSEDDTLAGQQPTGIGPWVTLLRVAAGEFDVVVDTVSGGGPDRLLGASRTLDTTIDLTEVLNDDLTGLLYTVTLDTPQTRGLPDGDNWQGRGSARYGWGIVELALRWTLRPPRYRWIYGEETSVAYRRTFPRDDSLAGGAGRNFPPSRAIQSSNRIGGGYL